MKPKKRIQEMTFAALLTAIAILIPSIMPIKLIIPPASYTLGSHVPIFLAMFISPWVAAFVILASSLGYFMEMCIRDRSYTGPRRYWYCRRSWRRG